jgi:hypothetical protein
MRPLDRAQLSATPDLPRVWVTTTNHSTVVLDKPEIVGDTLNGQVQGREERIPLSDVSIMQQRVVSGSRTRNLALLVGAVAAGATVALLNGSNNNQPKQGLCQEAADLPPVSCACFQVSNGQNPPTGC